MAKTMAQLREGRVVNLVWCSSSMAETEELKDIQGRPVAMGDRYLDGKFCRDGVEVLTPYGEAIKRIAELEAVNADQAAALTAIYTGVNG